MTLCQACHQGEAVVRLTQIAGDEVTTLHLCSKCAAERGIETEAEVAQTPLGAFLAAMGKNGAAVAVEAAAGETCSACDATLQDFRASGRLGCAQCWITFERPLRDLVRRLHGATRHSGETYQSAAAGEILSTDDERERRRGELKQQLRLAISAEQFEQAAELRDQLRVLDTG